MQKVSILIGLPTPGSLFKPSRFLLKNSGCLLKKPFSLFKKRAGHGSGGCGVLYPLPLN